MKKKPANAYMSTVKVGPKGQILIPKEIRDMFGIEPGDNMMILARSDKGIALMRQGMDQPMYLFHQRFEGLFHGTGDVFASFLLGALMNEQPLEKAAQTALDMTHAAIVETLKDGEHLRYGMQFEKVLPLFWQRIHD